MGLRTMPAAMASTMAATATLMRLTAAKATSMATTYTLRLRHALWLHARLLLRARCIMALHMLALLLRPVMLLCMLLPLRCHTLCTLKISMLRITAIDLRRISVKAAGITVYCRIVILGRITIKAPVMILGRITTTHIRAIRYMCRSTNMMAHTVHGRRSRATVIS